MQSIPEEFFDIKMLNTVSGAAVAVYLVVRFTKPLLRGFLPDWAVRVYTLALSWLILTFARAIMNGLTLGDWGLLILDGFVVAFAAMGLHEAIHDPRAQKVFLHRRK